MIVNDLLTVKNQTALFVPLHKKRGEVYTI